MYVNIISHAFTHSSGKDPEVTLVKGEGVPLGPTKLRTPVRMAAAMADATCVIEELMCGISTTQNVIQYALHFLIYLHAHSIYIKTI